MAVRKYPIEECPILPSQDSDFDTEAPLDRDIGAKGSRFLSLAVDTIEVDILMFGDGDKVGGNCTRPKNWNKVCRRQDTLDTVRIGERKREDVPSLAFRGSLEPASSPRPMGSNSSLDSPCSA